MPSADVTAVVPVKGIGAVVVVEIMTVVDTIVVADVDVTAGIKYCPIYSGRTRKALVSGGGDGVGKIIVP